MTDTRASDLDPDEPHDMAEPDAAASAPDVAGSAVAELARENADLKDRLLRALAEMENLRRRTEREVADSRAYAITAFARDLLGVADNMRRALDAVGTAAQETVDPGMRGLIDGVELTERELINVLEKHGVKKLDPQGTKFDPHRHQAMLEVPDASVPAGTIVQVVQPGYTIGERVLRPALVTIAKGAPKGGPAEGAPVSANDNSADSG
jgi:molecular chaperone GrpE